MYGMETTGYDDSIIFADDKGINIPKPTTKWKVIVADDEEEVHHVTRMVLRDFSFDNKGIQFLDAYTGNETLEVLKKNPDSALILLDVVMETDDAGLLVAKKVREELCNSSVRIILRTGQPGQAPEKRVIMEYDINDYKEKAELTIQKLFTTITTALRSYRDIVTIQKSKKGLEQIIDASARLFEIRSLKKFARGVLLQLISILCLEESAILQKISSFAATNKDRDFYLLAATGKFEQDIDKPVYDVVPEEIGSLLNKVIDERKSLFTDDVFVGYFPTKSGSENLLYLKGFRALNDLDKELIMTFATNVGVAFDNIFLNDEIVKTQNEVIFTLGKVVELRSKETANHVRRVSEYSKLLARKSGVEDEEAELIKLASSMHDLGKIGISDKVLKKPGKLSKSEFNSIKKHSEFGYDLLKASDRPLLKAAAIISLQHHERWDGKGYPKGLKGEDIHLYGRIVALADEFDALCHKRVYKEAWPIDKVIDFIKSEREGHFDPQLVDIFMENIDEIIVIKENYPDDDM